MNLNSDKIKQKLVVIFEQEQNLDERFEHGKILKVLTSVLY